MLRHWKDKSWSLQWNIDFLFFHHVPNSASETKTTCSVDPGPVSVELSLNLLLAPQLHEGPAVFHPLPLLGKFPKEPNQTTETHICSSRSRDSELHYTSSGRHTVDIKSSVETSRCSVNHESRGEGARQRGSHLFQCGDNDNESPINLSAELINLYRHWHRILKQNGWSWQHLNEVADLKSLQHKWIKISKFTW